MIYTNIGSCCAPETNIMLYHLYINIFKEFRIHRGLCSQINKLWYMVLGGLPGGSVVKNLTAFAGDASLIPGLGRSLGEGNGNPLQYSCLEKPMDRGAWWGHKESDTTQWLNNKKNMTLDRFLTPCKPQSSFVKWEEEYLPPRVIVRRSWSNRKFVLMTAWWLWQLTKSWGFETEVRYLISLLVNTLTV